MTLSEIEAIANDVSRWAVLRGLIYHDDRHEEFWALVAKGRPASAKR